MHVQNRSHAPSAACEQSWCRHEASGFPLPTGNAPDNVTCSQLHSVAPKNDVPVPLWQEIYMTFMPSVLLLLSGYSPHMPTVVTSSYLKNPLCMIAVNIPVYIYIRLCVCSAGIHDTISMCYIGRRDVSRVFFSANVPQPTAQPQQEKTKNHHPSSRLIYKLYIFIHKCKKWFANCVEKQVKRMTW